MTFKITEKLEWGPLATFVPNKNLPVYNWLYYKEGYSRDLVFNFAKMFGLEKGQIVLDSFCGSGTTLLACKELGINSFGFDALPISVFTSKVKTADYNIEELRQTAQELFSKRFVPMTGMPEWTKKFFSPYTRQDIIFFHHNVQQIPDSKIRDFFLLGLINTAMKCSWVWKDGGALKIKKHPVPLFRKFYSRAIKKMIKDYSKLPETGAQAFVEFGDARKLQLKSESIDAVITSPPYLNQIDYTKVYSVEDWFVGKPRPGVRAYLGLRESFEHKLEPVETYMHDMEQMLKECHRVCKSGAKLVFVIGNAYIERKSIDCDFMLAEIAERVGFEVKEIIVLNKRWALEERTQKKGILRESAVVIDKV